MYNYIYNKNLVNSNTIKMNTSNTTKMNTTKMNTTKMNTTKMNTNTNNNNNNNNNMENINNKTIMNTPNTINMNMNKNKKNKNIMNTINTNKLKTTFTNTININTNKVKNTTSTNKLNTKTQDFTTNILNIFDLINKNDTQSIINVKTISKQYLAYYIYRIITKYLHIIEEIVKGSDFDELYTLLRIPASHNRILNYPLAGKMTNDEQILDMIILRGIDMIDKLNKNIINKTDNKKYEDFLNFIEQKELPIIVQDLIDLQKLIPGLSVSAIRPNYLDDSNKT